MSAKDDIAGIIIDTIDEDVPHVDSNNPRLMRAVDKAAGLIAEKYGIEEEP